MAKRQNVYDGVSYDKLRNEIKEVIVYITSEKMRDIVDSIHYRTAPKGGVIPSITVTIEKKIETQLVTIESCCKILKSLLDKEGMSPFIQMGITSLIDKLNEIQEYFAERPLTTITDRMLPLNFGKGVIIETLAQSKESQITFRTKILERILKVIPLVEELKSLKDAVLVKGGYEIPHRMKLKRN